MGGLGVRGVDIGRFFMGAVAPHFSIGIGFLPYKVTLLRLFGPPVMSAFLRPWKHVGFTFQ